MATFVIGDLHGYFETYRALLRDGGLIDAADRWCGADAVLWLTGDLFDRGPQGVDCLRLTRTLATQAAAAGGQVDSLLGNHDMMILCVRRFRERRLMAEWLDWGGQSQDLDSLTDEEAEWLADRPALVLADDHLLMHADASLYMKFGKSIDKVNRFFRKVLDSDDVGIWRRTIDAFTEHDAFSGLNLVGRLNAERMLAQFGGRQIVHGHTPIPLSSGAEPKNVREAWIYAGGLCVNVDPGIYFGGPGFVHRL